MPRTAMSNRERREARAQILKAARYAKTPGVTVTARRVVREASEVPTDRDGLEWLLARNRLTASQAREAKAYRRDFQDAAASGATMKSCLDVVEGHGSGGPSDKPMARVVYNLDAQRSLFRKRFEILQGHAKLIEVLDAVCGRRVTLRDLALGNASEAKVLEDRLGVALDFLAKGATPAA